MPKLVLDEATLARLKELTGPATVVDAGGAIVGFYTPAIKPLFVPPPSDQYPRSPEELQMARSQKGGRPLEEILRDVGAG